MAALAALVAAAKVAAPSKLAHSNHSTVLLEAIVSHALRKYSKYSTLRYDVTVDTVQHTLDECRSTVAKYGCGSTEPDTDVDVVARVFDQPVVSLRRASDVTACEVRWQCKRLTGPGAARYCHQSTHPTHMRLVPRRAADSDTLTRHAAGGASTHCALVTMRLLLILSIVLPVLVVALSYFTQPSELYVLMQTYLSSHSPRYPLIQRLVPARLSSQPSTRQYVHFVARLDHPQRCPGNVRCGFTLTRRSTLQHTPLTRSWSCRLG